MVICKLFCEFYVFEGKKSVLHETSCLQINYKVFLSSIISIINTVPVMFDNYDWRMMLKLLAIGVSSYRRRIKAERRLKGGAKTMYVLVG